MKRPGILSEELLGAMVAAEPVAPVAWAIAKNDNGQPLYLVAYVMGAENIGKVNQLLEKVRPAMKPVPADLGLNDMNLPQPERPPV